MATHCRPESSADHRWEARARVDYPLHYLIWLREHKLLELELDSLNADNNPADQVILRCQCAERTYYNIVTIKILGKNVDHKGSAEP